MLLDPVESEPSDRPSHLIRSDLDSSGSCCSALVEAVAVVVAETYCFRLFPENIKLEIRHQEKNVQ